MKLWIVLLLRTLSLLFLIYCVAEENETFAVVTSGILLIGSFAFLKPSAPLKFYEELIPKKNVLKGKPKHGTVDENTVLVANEVITKLVTYDAEQVEALDDFAKVKLNTECVFAKNAKLWGSSNWNYKLSLEENVYHTLPTFLKFCIYSPHLGLDGFLYQLPNEYAESIEVFSSSVRRVMCAVSKYDPRELDCMRDTVVDRRGWVFRFHNQTFFVTTFAPFYNKHSSRYGFGTSYGYILFQPEISFAQHNIPDDTPITNWEKPRTVRDQIRVAYKMAGRVYKIRDTISYPMVYDIVKPLDEESDYIEWWKS